MIIYDTKIGVWIYALTGYFVWVAVGLLVKGLLCGRIRSFTNRTKGAISGALIKALDLPLAILIFVTGIVFVERISPLGRDAEFTRYFLLALRVTTVLAIILFIDKFSRGLIRAYSVKVTILQTSGSVVHGFVRIVVIGLGLLVLLDSFGISITPVLASLGVCSLAVALALQPTLENFFAGIQIAIDRPIQLGHLVKLDSGEEGYVHKVGWRSTWVRTLSNNMVVIPNKTLVNSKVFNYNYPDKEVILPIKVGVHYNSDLDRVEKITAEVAEDVMKTVPGAAAGFKPLIRYQAFNDFSIDFTVVLKAREFVDTSLITHEFIKRLHERYKSEGIVIPYPIRAVNYEQEKADKEA